MQRSDYLIIGGGTAGCILANRLSKNPANHVTLFEAGSTNEHFFVKTPAAFSKLFKTNRDWAFWTTPQKHLDNKKLYQPRGKMLGGCSSMNAMIYIRGSKKDFKEWEDLGNEEWSFEKVLPYFLKSEGNQHFLNAYHNRDGEQIISHPKSPNPLSYDLIEAAKNLGFNHNRDFNGFDQNGFGFYQLFQKDGQRYSTADAFLKPILNRKNLNIITDARVEKVLFEGKRAIGVEYYKKGFKYQAFANREVILSAGAFNSPAILLRSGVGPSEDLRAKDIEVIHESPEVGKNLQDHLIAGVSVESWGNTLDSAQSPIEILPNIIQMKLFKRGKLTSNIGEAGGFVKSSSEIDAPDLQFMFTPSFFIRHGFDNPEGKSGMTLGATLLTPKSKGSLRLKSKFYKDLPEVDPNYFDQEEDINRLIFGYKLAEKILYQAPLSKSIKNRYLPLERLEKEEEIADHIRQTVQTLYHPVGTCRMGIDETAVVGQDLFVKGVQRLRIADASIMPKIVRGNTQACSMMIAERAADMIIEARPTYIQKAIYSE